MKKPKTEGRGQKSEARRMAASGKREADIVVDTDKNCSSCGEPGATQTGRCLKCMSGELNRAARQQTLPGAEPELDPVGLAAKRFQRVTADIEELHEEKTNAEAQLIERLREAGRRSIRIGTLTLVLTHKDATDKISVKKVK